jgi:hypothetical protein
MNYLMYLMMAGLIASTPAAAHEGEPAHATPVKAAGAATPAPKLQAALRGLWHAHVEHTRDYALAVHANDAAAKQAAAEAVVANAKQIADAVAGFYGRAAGEKMLALLAGHWGAVAALTDAEHAGDRAAYAKAMEALTANAGGIATFLADANPYLPADAVRGLLLAHGAHHAAQVGQVMRGDTVGEAATWKAMQAHMDTIADALAGALAKQFPAKAA